MIYDSNQMLELPAVAAEDQKYISSNKIVG